MFTNAVLGGLLALAAPVLAVYVKDKVEAEMRKKALELGPAALREAASRIGPKLDEMIQDFAKRLDAWVVTAGEELHREVIEVLQAARTERAEALPGAQSAIQTCEVQGESLVQILGRLEGLRTSLWTPANGEAKAPPQPPAQNAPGGQA
jgi:type II secretory pathway pseudopilin PulG